MKLAGFLLTTTFLLSACQSAVKPPQPTSATINKSTYQNQFEGFWLGQSIANWTGLVTEMDKIGGDGPHGRFYTRDDWGKADMPSIWGQGIPSNLSPTIDWVFENEQGQWGSDDDTDIEYLYLHLLANSDTLRLTPEQIRNGWLTHIYSDGNTPFRTPDGKPENYLWVSNQQAHDLMRQGMLPPDTSAPENNPHYDMIDAQLTTEIFGFFAPGMPDTALNLAALPITTTAREDARWAAEFYVVMYSLAAVTPAASLSKTTVREMADTARTRLPDLSYVAKMYDFVAAQYDNGLRWEEARDAVYQRYQVEQGDGYDMSSRNLYCNGCFAAGINFAASIISLLYGEGDFMDTVKIAVLAGWDSDNPAATWGGMLGFIYGRENLEKQFNRHFSSTFNIHRTRGGFDNNGIDSFEAMAARGVAVTERVVLENGGRLDKGNWLLPADRAGFKQAPVEADYPYRHHNKKP